MFKVSLVVVFLLGYWLNAPLWADEWRSEPLSSIDRHFMDNQVDTLDSLARLHFGGQLNGDKTHDLQILQRLLDEKIVKPSQTKELQAMGVVLGRLLQVEKGLNWIVYIDKYGRSRALQLPRHDDDFIFPTTQISRKVEVGLPVKVVDVYEELQGSIEAIRNKPRF